jgi:hypothetical protein
MCGIAKFLLSDHPRSASCDVDLIYSTNAGVSARGGGSSAACPADQITHRHPTSVRPLSIFARAATTGNIRVAQATCSVIR